MPELDEDLPASTKAVTKKYSLPLSSSDFESFQLLLQAAVGPALLVQELLAFSQLVFSGVDGLFVLSNLCL